MLRPANAVDIPELIELLERGRVSSRYADAGGIDLTYSRQFMHELIVRHGGRSSSGTNCMVVEREGRIFGMLFALKQRIQLIGTRWEAVDAFWFVESGRDAMAAIALLANVVAWAKCDPRIMQVLIGLTDTIEDYERAAELLKRVGFEPAGKMMRMAIEHQASEQRSVA